ncbi:MAG: hypothetical protein JRC68_07040, partial [Deltaproteobacteria bacterium]|nr:hypothetical protein [Deltaproteobacteria bacterium]
FLSVTAGGNITDSGTLVVAGDTTLDAGAFDITLDDAANKFSSVIITNGTNVALVDADSIDLGASTVAGTFDVTATGDITDSGALLVTGDTTLDAGANDITLDEAANNLNTVRIASGNNVVLVDSDSIDLGASTVSITLNVSATNGSITSTTGQMITSDDLILSATEGIGSYGNAINTTTTTNLTLTTGGLNNAGDIFIVETNALNTSQLTIATNGGGTQTVSLEAALFTVNSMFGDTEDNLRLIATSGNIEDDSILDPNPLLSTIYVVNANDLTLRVEGNNAQIGEPDPDGTGPQKSVPINILLDGALTASANNGSGGIFLEVPDSGDPLNPNNLTYTSIDAGPDGDIELIVGNKAVIDGSVAPVSFNNRTAENPQGTNLPNYNNMDYDTPNLDNMIRGDDLVIKAGNVGLTNSPQADVVNMRMILYDTGPHPSGVPGSWAAVISVRDPDPVLTTEPNHGGRLEFYPISIGNLPNRPGNVQIGNYIYTPDSEFVISMAVQAAASSMVAFSPQMESLEELLAALGGEDFFMAPPLWIDIEMEEAEEAIEDEEELTYLQGPNIFSLPDLRHVNNMPTLLGEVELDACRSEAEIPQWRGYLS